MIKLSIVVPNYNKCKYIKQMLDSLEPQLTDEVEVIYIDDGSTDNSVKIIESHKICNNTNFHLYKWTTNRWVSTARNAGIASAKGKYVTFIDSDDYVLPNYIQTLLSYVDDNQYDLYGFDYIDDPIHKGDAEIERGLCAYIWTGLYRLDYLNKYNIRFDNQFKEQGYGEDVDFYEKFLATNPKCKYTNDKIYAYHLGVENSLSNEDKEEWKR